MIRVAGAVQIDEATVAADEWLAQAKALYADGWWFEALWGTREPRAEILTTWGRRGQLRVLRLVPSDDTFPSLTSLIPAADWFERALRDRTGFKPRGHVDPRPFLFHETYPAGHVDGEAIPPDLKERSPRYPFIRHEGPGVFEIPVGPIHAGIIEPGHFRFTTAGEIVLDLEPRLNYTHKGTFALAQGKTIEHATRLMERLSGDNAAAHATAFTAAVEAALGAPAEPAVEDLRTAMVEMERLYNHLGDLAGIATDVAFATGASHFLALREHMLRWNQRLFGHRLLMNTVAVGGFHTAPSRGSWATFVADLPRIRKRFRSAANMVTNHSGLKERAEGTGTLHAATARLLGCVGPAARASGIERDARIDAPCLAYPRLPIRAVTRERGSVSSRMLVKADEAELVLEWLGSSFQDVGQEVTKTLPSTGTGEGMAQVEASRGAVLSWVRIVEGRVQSVYQRDPSFLNWRGLAEAVERNIIPDFPLINKSFNLSYSGSDA